MPLHLMKKLKVLEAENRTLKTQIEELTAKRDEIFYWYLDFCERVRDGGFVKLPPPNLKIVERSQVHVMQRDFQVPP